MRLIEAIIQSLKKGPVTQAHNAIAITTTSAEIDCRGYNAAFIQTDITVQVKNWTVKIQGSCISGGTFSDCYEGATLMSYQTNSSRIKLWKGIPDFIKIVSTEDEDGGKCSVWVQPTNVQV